MLQVPPLSCWVTLQVSCARTCWCITLYLPQPWAAIRRSFFSNLLSQEWSSSPIFQAISLGLGTCPLWGTWRPISLPILYSRGSCYLVLSLKHWGSSLAGGKNHTGQGTKTYQPISQGTSTSSGKVRAAEKNLGMYFNRQDAAKHSRT